MREASAPEARGRTLWRWLGWGLLAGFLAYLALRPESLPSRELLARIWRWELAPAAILASFAVLCTVVCRGLRWVVLAAGHAPASASILVAGHAWCTLLFQVVPLRGGDALKVVWMKLRGGSVVRATVAVVVERILDAACLASVLALAVLLDARAADFLGPAGRALFSALVCIGIAAFIAAGLAARQAHRWLAARTARGRLWRAAADAADAVVLLGKPLRFLQCCILSALAWAGLVACYAILLNATVDTPLATGLAALALTTLATLFGITPGSLGIFEAAGVMVLAAYGVPADTALASVALLHLVLFGAQAAAGIAARIYLSFIEPPLLRSR